MPPRRTPERLLAIVDAATEVFAQSGFAGAQIVDIAQTAGVSVGTIYNYVEGKEALLLLCAERPFADIAEGRRFPIPTPDRHELIARLEETLDEHVRVRALERAVGTPLEPEDIESELQELVGELFDLLATTRVAADAMEQSARDAPDLGELFYRRVRGRLLEQLVEYFTRVDLVTPLHRPVSPDLAARFVLETVTWWARHRHRDPAPPKIEDIDARETVTILICAALANGPVDR